MNILSWIGLFMGSLARSPWTQWWNQGIGPRPMPSGTPPVDYTQLTQAQLLSQFSDAIGPNGITPRSLRNLVASTVTMQPGGSTNAIPLPLPGWTTANRPNVSGLAGPVIGYNYTLQQLDLWDNEAGEWINANFPGGFVPNAANFNSPVQMNAGFNSNAGGNITGNFVMHLAKSPVGLPSGTLWSNGNTVNIVP